MFLSPYCSPKMPNVSVEMVLNSHPLRHTDTLSFLAGALRRMPVIVIAPKIQ